MISTASISSVIRNIGLMVVIAVSTAFVAGLAAPAQAAGYIKFDGVDGESKASLDEFSVKTAELEAAMASLTAQLATIEALSLELQRLGGDITMHQEEARKGNVEYSWKVEEGEKIFTEQIASLLDPALAQQVLDSLAQLKLSYLDQDDDGDSVSTMEEDLSAMLAAVGVCRESVTELSQTSSKIVKEWNASTPMLSQTVAK